MSFRTLQTLFLLALTGFISGATIPSLVRSSDHQHQDNNDWQQPSVSTRRSLPAESETDYWLRHAQDFVRARLSTTPNLNRAKNIVFFLGDGMSAATVAATRPYINAEQTELSFERFPDVGQAKTYCVDKQVADSACTATAYLCGIKANYATLGVSAAVQLGNCTQQLDVANQVRSIAARAQAAGKWTGLVTTSTVTSASPAGLYAHAADRNWQSDVQLRRDCDDPRVLDIAAQLVTGEVGGQFRVVMGGGRSVFRGFGVEDEEEGRGEREDGRNLIAEWAERKGSARTEYLWNATRLRQLDMNNVDYLLGLFEPSDMRYNREVLADRSQHLEPSLTEMTIKAIELLGRNPDGFVLFVENGLIDYGHHANYARLALDETVELSKAVQAARDALSEEDTLIVVTADHSHTMTYSGYTHRGDDINGMSPGSEANDGLPYMTLSYANGLGFESQLEPGRGRKNLTEADVEALRFRSPAMLPWEYETHAGDDVLVYASGPWSHLFRGNYEQHVIPHLMAHAAGV